MFKVGSALMGDWFCKKCDFSIFPLPLKQELENKTMCIQDNKPICKKCRFLLEYEEYA